MIAYYDQCYCTIRHVNCHWSLKEDCRSTRCSICRAYRYVLKSGIKHLHSVDSIVKSLPESHVNFRYLNTPEKIKRMKNMHKLICKKDRKISRLQHSLTKLIKDDGIIMDSSTNADFMTIMNQNTSTILTAEEKFKSLFWQQQMKAGLAKSSRGIRWHPAIIRWCLFLHHRSSGAYSTLKNSGILQLPSERTLRDYHHFAPAVVGFSTDTDKQLLERINSQHPDNLSKYIIIVIDEMYIKEGLIFNKHNGQLIGFQDLGEINNLLADYGRQHNENDEMFLRRPLAKTMVVFMVRGLFTSLKFTYTQFPTASAKGDDLFLLLWKAILRLTRLGLQVLGVTCDGAKSNRKMFKMHGLTNGVPYKTKNYYSKTNDPIFFICDPPHVLKTLRNCFSR